MSTNPLLQYYKDHVMTAEEAVMLVQSGDMILDGHGHGRSELLMAALCDRYDKYQDIRDVRDTTGYNLGASPQCDPKYEGIFRHVSSFDIGATRQAHWEGRADYLPCHFSQFERAHNKMGIDVVFCQCTPPNEDGYVSLGPSVDITRNGLDICRVAIAHVNPKLPWTNGDSVVPASAFAAFVECEMDILEIPESTNPSETDRKIAENVAQLVRDGDTLQIGVGTVPDTVLSLLTNHKHLGIHTELGSTGIMRLMQKGVIDNSMKTINPGKVYCTLMGGTREFYDFIDHNEDFVMRKSSYILDPRVISQHKNMVALNSSIEIDLYGQANSEMIGGKTFSGVGGQVDFLRGAMMSEGGRSIMCMSATAKKGTKSRIVPQLAAGTVVTASRYDIMYVVTEYGIADLFGKTDADRAKELIKVAAPQFREELERAFYENIYKPVR